MPVALYAKFCHFRGERCVIASKNHDSGYEYVLRTVPTKYKGFCARLGPRGKCISLQGLLESTKKYWDSHAFFRDN